MKQRKDAQSDYITTTDLAALCGVSRFTIINWADQGVIKCAKTVGGHRRIPRSEVRKVMTILRGTGQQSSKTSSGEAADVPATPEAGPGPAPKPRAAADAESVEEAEPEHDLESEADQEIEEAASLSAYGSGADTPAGEGRILKDVSYVMGRGIGGLRAGLSGLKNTLGGNAGADVIVPQ